MEPISLIQPPILYSFRRCPYAMRARMALLIGGIECELREVVLRDKPGELIAISPKATVPVLVAPDDQVIDQSLDIMHWALRRDDPENWLESVDDPLIPANDDAFKHHLDRYKYPNRHDGDPQQHRSAAVEMLEILETRLQRSDYLSSDNRSLVDIAIMPFVRQFANTDRVFFDALPLPKLQTWLATHIASPLFANAMISYPRWSGPDNRPTLLGIDPSTAAQASSSPDQT